jgi:tellurite resistance protein TerC
VLFIGSSTLVVCLAMIFLPLPAFVFIPAGLAILAAEFVWARRILRRMKREAQHLHAAVVDGEENEDGKQE